MYHVHAVDFAALGCVVAVDGNVAVVDVAVVGNVAAVVVGKVVVGNVVVVVGNVVVVVVAFGSSATFGTGLRVTLNKNHKPFH